MKKITIKCLLLLASVVVLTTIFSCGNKDSKAASEETSANQAGAAHNILRVGTDDTTGSLLMGTPRGQAVIPIALVFDYLLYVDPQTKELTSDIFDWKYSEDGKSVSITLRNDIIFSNGAPATGEDLLYSLISLDRNHPRGSAVGADSWDFASAKLKDDSYTVDISVLEGYSAINCFNQFFNQELMCKAWCEENGFEGEVWYTGPVSSGPYKVKEYVTNSYYLLELRDDYWMAGELDLPYKEIKVTYYKELSTMYMDLENGDLDIACGITSNDYSRALKDNGKIKVALLSGACTQTMAMDIDNGPLTDINVRKAVAHGVDWAAVSTVGYEKIWKPATSYIPADFQYYVNTGNYKFDQDLAKKYLSDGGYKPSDVSLEIYVMPGEVENMAISVKYYLNQIGIDLTVYSYDFSSTIAHWIGGDGDMQIQYTPGGFPHLNPMRLFASLSEGVMKNVMSDTDTESIELYKKAVSSSDEKVIEEYLTKLQHHVFDSYRLVTMNEQVDTIAWNSEVIKDVGTIRASGANLRFVVPVK